VSKYKYVCLGEMNSRKEGGREGETANLDVTIREPGSSDKGSVGNAHSVMDFVLLLEASQNRDGVFQPGFRHKHRLKAPG